MSENTWQDERREACETGIRQTCKDRHLGGGYQGPDVGTKLKNV
jgi:hypothetical protein